MTEEGQPVPIETQNALFASQKYADEVAPKEIAGDALHRSVAEAWYLGYEGRKLKSASSGAVCLAWAAGQRFKGAKKLPSPDACAEVPKIAHRPGCRDCKSLGKKCDICKRQLDAFQEVR